MIVMDGMVAALFNVMVSGMKVRKPGCTIMPYEVDREGNYRLLWDQPKRILAGDIVKKEVVVMLQKEEYMHDAPVLADGEHLCVGARAGECNYDLDEMPTLLFELIPQDTLDSIRAEIAKNSQDRIIRVFLVYFYDKFQGTSSNTQLRCIMTYHTTYHVTRHSRAMIEHHMIT